MGFNLNMGGPEMPDDGGTHINLGGGGVNFIASILQMLGITHPAVGSDKQVKNAGKAKNAAAGAETESTPQGKPSPTKGKDKGALPPILDSVTQAVNAPMMSPAQLEPIPPAPWGARFAEAFRPFQKVPTIQSIDPDTGF